jgi:hypothetical protein
VDSSDLARMLWQAEAKAGDALMQRMLDQLGQQTFVGGKRVAIQKLCLTGECLYRRAPSTSSTRRSPITETPGRGSRS